MTAAIDVIIAGGGIGGLTLALALDQVGIRARVYEAAAELGELGVGINILPHAAKEYAHLGVLDRLVADGIELERYMWFNRHGQQIWQEPRGRKAGYAWPQVSIHRGRFHRILADTVRERLGPDALLLDHQLQDFSSDANGATARFVSRRTGGVQAEVSAPLLVAADGIHSMVRARFYPDQGPPRWAGNMMWRMTVELERPLLGGSTMFAAGTGDIKVVAYEISAVARARGRSLCN